MTPANRPAVSGRSWRQWAQLLRGPRRSVPPETTRGALYPRGMPGGTPRPLCSCCSHTPWTFSFFLSFFLFFFFVFCYFFGQLLRQMEVPRLGVESELYPPAYARATAMQDLSRICNLHHSSRQHRILNPLSKARDRTRVLTDASRVC